jgi:hypothetical protein
MPADARPFLCSSSGVLRARLLPERELRTGLPELFTATEKNFRIAALYCRHFRPLEAGAGFDER